MAQENSQADYQEIELSKRARRRLVGSIALVILLIVFLPMLLEDKHPQDPHQDLVITIPAEQGTSTEASAPANNPTTSDNSAASSDTSSAASTANTSNPANSPPAEAAPVAEEKPAVAANSADSGKDKKATSGLMLQVGVFSDSANVKQLQSKLESNGFKVAINQYPNGKTRIRVGPYASKTEADAAIAKLQALKFNPMVVND